MTSTISPLARELRRLRAEKGLPMRKLAKQAGVSTKTVSLIELGKQHPSALTVAKLARGLGVDTGDLLGFEEGATVPKDVRPLDRPAEPTTRGIEERRTERAWEVLLQEKAARGEEAAEELRVATGYIPVGVVADFATSYGALIYLYRQAGGPRDSARLGHAEKRLRSTFAEVAALANQLFDPLDTEQERALVLFRDRRLAAGQGEVEGRAESAV